MRQRVLLLVLFTVLGISCDPSSPDVTAAGENYLPLAAGNMWEYDVRVVGDGIDTTEPVAVLLAGPFMLDSIAWYGVNNFCVDRATSSPLPLFCAAWGMRGNEVLFTRQGPGPVRLEYEVVLDFPVWYGKSWFTKPSLDTSYVTTSGDTIVMKRVSRRTYRGSSTLVVPAGTFVGCIEVADSTLDLYRDHPAGGGSGTEYYTVTRTSEWYAKNAGMVKQVVETITAPGAAPSRTETRTLRTLTVKGS